MIKHVLSLLGLKGVLALVSTALLLAGGWGEWRYYAGHRAGVEEVRSEVSLAAAHQRAALFDLRAKLAEKSAALEVAETARQSLVEGLENEAAQDPDAANRRPSDDSLRRLQERWYDPARQ